MPGYQHIRLEKDLKTHIGKLTLDRPDKRNALNDQTMDELGAALEDIEADDAIRVLIVTGAGRCFCAGGDLEALPNGSEPGAWASDNVDDVRRSFKRAQRFMLCLQRMEKPVIAMVNGPAVGAGFDIACACESAHPWLDSWSPTSASGFSQDSAAPGSTRGCWAA